MKIVFVSNFLNHHQLPFCLEMQKNNNIEYYFVATEEIPEERIKLGYDNMNSKYSFVIEAYKGKAEKEQAKKIINESDIVIIGSAPEEYIEERIEKNKLIFRYSERVFKKGIWHILDPRVLHNLKKNHTKYKKNKLYMLCAGAYVYKDFKLVGAYKNKCYKWGYFPRTEYLDISKTIELKEKNKKINILWAGRFIKWKHPELAIKLAKYLKKSGYNFKIQMIGYGPIQEKIKDQIIKYKLTEYIELLGPKKPEEVREYMKKSNIFIMTSDRNEGWGATINEAMNSACAVIANKKIGAVPYLIENMKNGITYKSTREFVKKSEFIIDNIEKRKKIYENAYKTIIETWNVENATKNFIVLSEGLLNNKENIEIEKGPCSKA